MAQADPPSRPETAEKPRRVALAFLGTRGDCQPYVALALGLRARGHAVRCFSSELHRAFVEAYGIEFAAFAPQRVELNGTQEQLKRFGQELFGDDFFGEDLHCLHKELRSFGPELLVAGTLSEKYCLPLGEAMSVPVVQVKLQPSFPNGVRAPFPLPSLPLARANLASWRLLFALVHRGLKAQDEACERLLGVSPWRGVSARALYDALRRPRFPSLVANPRQLLEALYGPLPRGLRPTGYLVLEASEQTSEAGNQQFGGAEARQELQAFLDKGEPPVCFGWGSMIPEAPERTVLRAVGAAKAAGCRAVIVGGWARLSREQLQAAAARAGRPELAEYAEENVIFVAMAPHEWLFPRCGCSVHHGGSGTTAVGLRAGRPSIVTPVALDQFDYAEMVRRTGAGLGLKQITRLSEQELGTAIRHVLDSVDIQTKAAELGRALRSERGVAAAVAELEKLMTLHDLGELRTQMECVRERQWELDQAPGTPGTPLALALLAASAVALRWRRMPRAAL